MLRTFGYDGEGRLATITDADGNVTTIERAAGEPTAIVGPFGARTILSTDTNGFLDAITNPAGETWAPSHGPGGLLDALTTPRNHSYAFFYDTVGRLERDRDPEVAGVDPDGGITLSREADGPVTTVTKTSAEGVVETREFEILAQGAEARWNTRPNPGGDPLVTQILIEADGSSRTVSEPDGTDITTVAGPDPRFGLQAPVIESLTIDTPGHSFERTTDRTATFAPVTGALATLSDEISVNGAPPITIDFDAATSTITTVSSEGRQVVREIDAQGRTTEIAVGPPPGSGGFHPLRFEYDASGRLEFMRQGTGVSERVTELQYDPDGNLRFVIDPLHTTELRYDDANRVDFLIRPDLQTVDLGYDLNGNLGAITPAGRPAHGFDFTKVDQERLYVPPSVAGTGSTTTHHNLDRQLDDIVRPGSATPALDFSHDAAGRLDALAVLGRGVVDYGYSATTGQLSSITTPEGSGLGLGYDGFLPETQTWTGTVAGTVAHDHNDELLIASEAVMGDTVLLQYDDDNLLVTAGALTLGPDVHHGLLRTTVLGSTTTSQDYSAFGELSNFEAKHGSNLLYREEVLLRDKLGRIVDRRETIGGVATDYHYDYDNLGRLWKVFVNSVLQAEYGYDLNGNRLTKTAGSVITGTYDNQDRIQTWGTLSFSHTPNGERLTKTDTATSQTTTYTTDALGNLLQAALPGGPTIDYVIDGMNRRIGKKVNGALVQGFLYRDQLEPVAELNGAGQLVSRFVYASKPHVPDYMVKGGQTYRIVSDHLGSVRLVVDASTGAIAQRIDYDEFGNVTNDTSPGFQPFGFAGGLYDGDTKLTRFGARDYDAETGRWTAKDPIRFDGGDTNLYGYVVNDPVNLVDPSGLATVSFGITGSGSYVGAGAGGGTFINFGYSARAGFSFSITGTAGAGVSAGAGAGPGGLFAGSVGFTLSVSDACDVSGLLGSARELSRGGVGRAGAGVFTSPTANGAFVTFGPQGSSAGITAASASVTTTSAIVQYSNGQVTIGNSGSGALFSF